MKILSNYKIIDLNNDVEWQTEINKVDHPVYHTWWYCKAMSLSGNTSISLFILEFSKGKVVGTFSKRSKENEMHDLFSPYGFGGLLKHGNINEIEFIKLWYKFGIENNLISGYQMLHPNFEFIELNKVLIESHSVFLIELSLSEEIIWRNFNKSHKSLINQSIKSNDVSIVHDKSLLFNKTIDLYYKSIKNKNASKIYHFSVETLRDIFFNPNALILGLEIKGELEAVVIFIFTNSCAEYFISATSEIGKNHTRRLIWEAIKLLKEKDVILLNLGGGITDGDSLEDFKRRFGGKSRKIQILKSIFQQDKYNYLCKKYNQDIKNENYFPPYWGI